MKKTILFLGAMIFALMSFAQKMNIQSASNSLRHKEYKEALEFIEKAVNDPSTKDDPKAWFIRGSIYLAMDQDPGYADEDHYKEAVRSFKKVLDIKPGYEQQAVTGGLIYGAYKAYNNSVNLYNAKKWEDAYSAAEMAVGIHGMTNSKNFPSNPAFDTVAANAMVIQAYSAFYGEKPEKALPILLTLKDNPIEGSANTYLIIADVYRQQNAQDKELAILAEAKAKYPDDENVRNEELNYYIRTNQQDKLIAKLEAAIAEDANNPIYYYNLANTYSNIAFAESGKPDNYDDLLLKAETGFKKAIEMDPKNAGYHYDLGVLYFNQASKYIDEMNDLPISEEAKINELSKKSDALIEKAFAELQVVYDMYEPKESNLTAEEMVNYKASLRALREIYARKNMLDKSKEMKEKLEALN